MSDPIIINQIISSLGLSGEEAQAKRKELEKLSDNELQLLISNKANLSQGTLFGFQGLKTPKFEPVVKEVFSSSKTGKNGNMGLELTQKEPKKYSAAEEKELINFAANYLYDSAKQAMQIQKDYHDSIGYISADAIVQGFKAIGDWTWDAITGRNDVNTVWETDEQVAKDYKSAEKIKNASNKKGAFEAIFERERGIAFDAAAVDNLKTKSEEFLKVTAYSEKYNNLTNGIKELKNLYAKEEALAQAKSRGQIVPDAEETFDAKLVEVLDEFCSGDIELRNKYIAEISKGITNKNELKKKFLSTLDTLQNKCKSEMEKSLNGKTYEQYQKEYNAAYKKAFGGEDVKQKTEAYVNMQKTLAGYTQMGVVIATTIMTGGSAAIAKGTSSLAGKVGVRTAQQVMKAGMTALPMAENLAIDVTSALTSKSGLTEERGEQIIESQKASLPYMIFGAYAAGPLGESVKTYLKSSPKVLPNLMNKAFAKVPKAASGAGLTAEIAADTFFHTVYEDSSLLDAFKTEGSMDASMRVVNKVMTALVGGRAHGAAKNIAQMAGLDKYTISETITPNGQKLYTVKSQDGQTFKTDAEGVMVALADKCAETIVNNQNSFKKNDVKIISSDEEVKLSELEQKGTSSVEVDSASPKVLSEESFNDEMLNYVSQLLSVDRNSENIKDFVESGSLKEAYQIYKSDPQKFIEILEKDSKGNFIYADQKYEILLDCCTSPSRGNVKADVNTIKQLKEIYKYFDLEDKSSIKASDIGITEQQFNVLNKIYSEYKSSKSSDAENLTLELYLKLNTPEKFNFISELLTKYNDMPVIKASEIAADIQTKEQEKLVFAYCDKYLTNAQDKSYEFPKNLLQVSTYPEGLQFIKKLLDAKPSPETTEQLQFLSTFPEFRMKRVLDRGLLKYEKLSLSDIKDLSVLNDKDYNLRVSDRKLLEDNSLTVKDIVNIANLDDAGYNFYKDNKGKYNNISSEDVYNFAKYETFRDIISKFDLFKYENLSVDDITHLAYIGNEAQAALAGRPELLEARRFNATDIKILLNLKDNKYQRLIQNKLIENSDLDATQLSLIASLSENVYQKLKANDALSYKTYSEYDLCTLADCSDYKIQAIMKLKQILNKNGIEYSLSDLSNFVDAKLQNDIDDFDIRFNELVSIKGYGKIHAKDLREYISLNESNYAEVKNLLSLEVNGKNIKLSANDIKHELSLKNNAPDTYNSDRRKYVFDKLLKNSERIDNVANDIKITTNDVDEVFNILKEDPSKEAFLDEIIYIANKKSEQFSGSDIVNMLRDIPKEKYDLAKKLFYCESRNPQLKSNDIIAITKSLSNEDFNKIQPFLYVAERGKYQLNGEEIVKLALLSPDEYGKIKNLVGVQNSASDEFCFSGDILAYIAKNANETLYKEILSVHNIKHFTLEEIKALCDTNEQTFQNLNQILNSNSSYPHLEAIKLSKDPNLFAKTFPFVEKGWDYKNINNIITLSSEDYQRCLNYLNKGYSQELVNTFLTSKDPDVDIKYTQVIEEARKKRNQLKSGLNDLTDKDIDDFFLENNENVVKAIDLLGIPTFVYSYSSKFSGVEYLLDATGQISSKLTDEMYTILKSKLADKSLEPQEKIAKIKALSAMISSDPENNIKYIELIKSNNPTKEEINTAKAIFSNPKVRYDDKIAQFCETFNLDPEDKKLKEFFAKRATVNAKGYKILNGVKEADLVKFLSTEVVRPRNLQEWNQAIDKKVYESVGVEYTKELSDKLGLADNRYIVEILSSNNAFKEGFEDIVSLIKENPDKSIREIFDELPQNIETKRIYDQYGIDYNKWVDVNKNSYKTVAIRSNSEKAKQAAITNLEEDFNDIAFNKIPSEEKDKINQALNEIGITLKENSETIYDNDGYIAGTKTVLRFYTIKDQPIAFNNLPKILSTIKSVMNESEFWTKTNDDPAIDEARKTVYNHIMKLRDAEITNASNIKDDEVSQIEIHKTDMNNIKHSLFLGNQGACCTAVGTGCNQYAAPRYVMDKCISAIELVDGKDFVGNTMCYFAEVDGKLSLVLDNIELNNKYQYNDKIRDVFMEYAEQICKEVGQPDIPIYAGPYRHKLNMNCYSQAEHSVKILGSTNGESTYIDFVTGKYIIDNEKVDQVKLYKIK